MSRDRSPSKHSEAWARADKKIPEAKVENAEEQRHEDGSKVISGGDE